MTNSTNSSEHIPLKAGEAVTEVSSPRSPQPASDSTNDSHDPTTLTKANLLLVDDNPDNLRLLSRMLTRKQYATELAHSGREALSIAKSMLPDLILLDITMPEMDGYEVCQRLKANPQTREIPVIFISALSEVMDKVRAFGAGGVDYIMKPFQFAEVLARLENHLTLKRLQKQLAEQNERLQAEVKERQRAEQALQEKEEYLRLILNNIPQQVFWKDTDQVFRGCNQNWAAATQLKHPEDVVGKTNYDLFSPRSVAETFQAQDRAIIENDRPVHMVIKKQRTSDKADNAGKPGKRMWLDMKKLPIHDEDGHVIGILGVFEDITERKISEQALQLEKQRTDQLLLNILPQAIVDRLKTIDGSIADRFDEATVLFADIVGFTGMSAQIPPTQVVNMLNEIFSTFDRLAERHKLEKIKTIGDSYMVAGGIPVACNDHVEAVANMAIDMLTKLDEIREHIGLPLQIRIGINTGPVVAGVIGVKKFIYDLWGDTVNVASRMESTGEPNRIQVTDAIYQRLRDRFEFEPRGLIQVKGKGAMQSYWLVRKVAPDNLT
jgi:adenylate cyclase